MGRSEPSENPDDQSAREPRIAQVADPYHAAAAKDESSSSGSDSSSSDDDNVGNGGGGIRSKRRRVETRSKKRVVMPSAAVCIEFDATLWPAESERFTDGVEEVFLEGEDEDDDVSLGMIFPISVMQGTNEEGEWGRASRQVLEEYEKNERSFQDANV